MEKNIGSIVLIGSMVSLVGTMVGASLGVIIKEPSKKMLGTIIGFAAGLMMSVVVFDLIPEALTKWNFVQTLACCIFGIVIIIIIDSKVNMDNVNTHVKVAFMAGLGLMIHNLPEGMIMGCGFAAGGSLGIRMSLIIAIHDIPEGIAVAAPLIASRVKAPKVLLYAFITAFPTAIGACIGAYIANISLNVLGACLSLASGIMLYVVCCEMIPESSRLWNGRTSTIGTLTGIIVGLIIVKMF